MPTVDVRAALAAVESGAAQAGVVYATDAAITARVRIAFEVPAGAGPEISYSLGCLAGCGAPARSLFDYLGSVAAAPVFARHGFRVLDP